MKRFACVLTAVLLLTGCAGKQTSSQEPQSSVSVSVEEPNMIDLEYTVNDMKGYIWAKQPAAEFRQVTWTEALRLFREKGTGVLLMGYESCKYCQRAVPLLSDAAKEKNQPIYYIDVYAEPQPTEDEFNEMCDWIDETLDKDENGEPIFFVPAVIGIRNGVISGYHISLVDGFEPVKDTDQLSDEQKGRLKNIYLEILDKTF